MINKREEILKTIEKIEHIPATVTKIYKLLKKRDEVDFKELVRMIEYDPSLNHRYFEIFKIQHTSDSSIKSTTCIRHSSEIGMDNHF